MKNEQNLPSIKAIMNAAREIEAGGEAHHKIFGEISISVERLAKINKELADGDKWAKEEIQEFITSLFKEGKDYLGIIYDDQKKKRDFLTKIFFWGYVAMFIAAVVTALVISWPF